MEQAWTQTAQNAVRPDDAAVAASHRRIRFEPATLSSPAVDRLLCITDTD